MGLSDTGNDIIGGLGGAILAVMMLPQLYQLIRTKSAKDLSYAFLYMYVIGLTLVGCQSVGSPLASVHHHRLPPLPPPPVQMTLYLYFVDALVAAIFITIQVSLSVVIILAKYYFDNYGPNSIRNMRQTRLESKLTTSSSFAERAQGKQRDFFDIGAQAPFQLVPSPSHRAEHIILDCKLKGKKRAMSLITQHMEDALVSSGLELQEKNFLVFPSFKRQRDGSMTAEEGGGAPDHFFFHCKEGYAMGLWYSAGEVLSVDMLAAERQVIECMRKAAERFSKLLQEEFPGAKIAGSVMARLPE